MRRKSRENGVESRRNSERGVSEKSRLAEEKDSGLDSSFRRHAQPREEKHEGS